MCLGLILRIILFFVCVTIGKAIFRLCLCRLFELFPLSIKLYKSDYSVRFQLHIILRCSASLIFGRVAALDVFFSFRSIQTYRRSNCGPKGSNCFSRELHIRISVATCDFSGGFPCPPLAPFSIFYFQKCKDVTEER